MATFFTLRDLPQQPQGPYITFNTYHKPSLQNRLDGILTKAVTTADITLSADEAMYGMVKLTGAPVAGHALIYPIGGTGMRTIWNTCGQTITVKYATGSTVAVADGVVIDLLLDGADVRAGGGAGYWAPLNSPALTGTPTAPTVAGSTDSSTKIATTAFVQAVATATLAAIRDGVSSALDTLAEVATSLSDKASISLANTFAGVQRFQQGARRDFSTPAQITGNQNNYDAGTAPVARLSSDASRNITGISGGTDGREIELHNIGSFNIVLQHDNASSSAANRIYLPNNNATITIVPGSSTLLRYDGTSSRWRVAARGMASGTVAGTFAAGDDSRIFAPTAQLFSTSGTYTIPAGAVRLRIVAVGGGSGGGSGRRGAAGTARFGGGSGAGGGRNDVDVMVSDLSGALSLNVTIGAGGIGGGAVTANDTSGSAGSAGSETTVDVAGTVIARGTAGTAGSGGGGGGISSGDVPGAGGNGGRGGIAYTTPSTPPGGTVPGGNGATPSAPTAPVNHRAGDGGGGGGASITGTGGTGGDGVRGGGGGGGGAALNGNNSGAGGTGGDGYAIVYAF